MPAARDRLSALGGQGPGLAVFAVAAAVRLWLSRHAQFGGEESVFYETVRKLADGRAFPRLGPPVTGGSARHPGGLFFYLLAPSQLVSATPEAAYAWVALLGAISVWLFWAAVRRAGFGGWGAFVAGLLMALSPWSVFYADRVWNSNVVGILVALAFYAAVRVRERPSTRWVAVLVFSSLIMPQVHLSAPVVWVALAVLVGPRRVNLRWAALGATAALVAYVPYLASEWASGFGNVRSYLRESGGLPARVPLAVPLYVARFLTLDTSYFERSGHSLPVTQRQLIESALFGDPCRPFHPLRLAALGLSAVLAVSAVVSAVRCRAWRPFGLATAAGVLADMALVGWSRKVVFPHYVQPLLPFLFTVFATLPRRWWVALLVAAYGLGALDAVAMVARHMDAKNSLPVQRRVIERLLLSPERQVQLAIEFQGYVYSYQVLSNYGYGGRLTFGKQGPVYLLIETDGTRPPAVAAAEVETLGRVTVDLVETVGPVTLYRARPRGLAPL
jgi:hypothetical protein